MSKVILWGMVFGRCQKLGYPPGRKFHSLKINFAPMSKSSPQKFNFIEKFTEIDAFKFSSIYLRTAKLSRNKCCWNPETYHDLEICLTSFFSLIPLINNFLAQAANPQWNFGNRKIQGFLKHLGGGARLEKVIIMSKKGMVRRDFLKSTVTGLGGFNISERIRNIMRLREVPSEFIA